MLRAQALPVIVWAHTAERHLDPLPVVPIHVFGELRLQLGRRSPLPAGPVVHLDLERSGELLVGGVVRAARLPRHRPRQAMPVHEANPTAPAATHSPVGAGDRVSSLGQRVGSCAGLLFGISPRPPSAMQITSQLQTEPADFAPRSAATGLGSSPLVTRRAASGFKIRRAEPPFFYPGRGTCCPRTTVSRGVASWKIPAYRRPAAGSYCPRRTARPPSASSLLHAFSPATPFG